MTACPSLDTPMLQRHSIVTPRQSDDAEISAAARKLRMEVIVSKRLRSPYRSGNSKAWILLPTTWPTLDKGKRPEPQPAS
jgi:hypothetical protein